MRDLGIVTRAEWRRVSLFAAGVMLITTLPYVLGWLRAGETWQFSGFLFGVEDGNSYLAKMRLGAQGHWLFTIRYTAEPHDGALLFLPYLLLGHITRLVVRANDPALPNALMLVFHAARVICGFLLILTSYRFVAVFLRRPGTRWLALVLIALGGGLGWLLTLVGLGHWLGSLPIDFYVPEGYSFLILFGLPHLALARCAMLLGFVCLFRAMQGPDYPRARWQQPFLAGLSWTVMGLCVPFYIPVVYLILGSWGLASWLHARRFPWALFWRATGAAAVTLPLLGYTGIVFATNDVLGEWSAQNQLQSPHLLHYVSGYIVLAIPAVVAVRWAWRRGASPPYLLLAAWIVVAPIAVYLPINVQRRLAEGVIVPVSILAAAGLRLAFPARLAYRRARAALLVLALPTAALLWLGGMFSAFYPNRPLFHPQAEIAALRALDQAAPPDAVVLSSKATGNVLPVYTDLVAYAGHGPETLDLEAKEERVKRFFAGTLATEEQRDLLAEVDYVFWGPLEKPETSPPPRAWAALLHALPYSDSDYTLYEVQWND